MNTAANLTGSLHTRFWSGSAFNVEIKSIKINGTGTETLSYTYDDNGNIATAPNKVFTYNWQNQIQSMVVAGATTISSQYDDNGQRFIYKTPNTTEIQIDDSYILRNGAPEINISVNGTPIGLISGGAIYSNVVDHLGTPVKTLNNVGVVSESSSYGPFGAVLLQTGSLDKKKGYTGHEEDVETGLTYMEARYYDPVINRFLSQDPAFIKLDRLSQQIVDPQGWNSYAYARNNPIRLVDPDGEWPTWAGVANTIRSVSSGVNNFFDRGPFQGFGVYDIVNPVTTIATQAANVIDPQSRSVTRVSSAIGIAATVVPPAQESKPIVSTVSKIEWGGMWTSKGRSLNPINNLGGHARSHAADLGFDSTGSYYHGAKDFLSKAVDRGYEATYRAKDATIRIWNSTTRRFAAYKYQDGKFTPKTFMKAERDNYWTNQQGTKSGQKKINLKGLIGGGK